ncbi:hypothetical protein D9M71_419000 [compost metagenome]
MAAVTFAKGVVEETRQDVHFLARTAQAIEEAFLRLALDHEIGTGHQQLGRQLDSLGVCHHAVGGFVQA